MENYPPWLKSMDEEDLYFVKRLVLASGSLKQLAQEYGVTYPTIRLRLDRLIEKIKIRDEAHENDDELSLLIKNMAINGEISKQTAKQLINAYWKTRGD
ncbi:MAG: DUF2089 family protein [Syntrophomonadaceae bacterium]|jgi:hypothetical protein